jgi:4-amino-4-deoxy-L-arabinose transferase-like glycosyltransferase
VVGIETKWEFLRGFFFKHHFERFRAPMEGHDGFLLYHPLVFLASFAPWSAFLGLTVWFGFGRRAREDRVAAQDRETRKQGDKGTMQTAAPISLSPCPLVPLSPSSPYRFLWCWFLLWMVFFSIAGTKLPNYLLPAFPAFAILTARFLVRWQAGQIQIHPAWMTIALGCLGFVGLVTTVILLTAAGAIPNISLRGRELPEVGWLVWIGLVPLAAAAWAGWCLWKQRRSAAVTAVAMGSVAFVSLVAALVPVAVDQRKAPRVLAREMAANQEGREVQIGCFASYQPGLVYYSRRKVDWLKSPDDVVDWIHSPVQTYLVIPEDAWGSLQSQVERPYRVVARQRDFMTGKDMLLITNLPPAREIVKSE